MRAVAVLLLAAALAACGGGDDDEADIDAGLTEARAAEAVEAVQLDAGDLGDGWDSTEVDAEDPVAMCIGTTITRALDDATLAASELVHLERDGEQRFESTRVSVRTIAVDDGAVLDDVVAVIIDPAFADCVAPRFEGLVSDGRSELTLQVGDVEVEEGYLPLDGVRSSSVAIPFHAEAPGFDFDAELGVVAVARDQLLSLLLTIELSDSVDGEDVARWAALLADRQRVAQSSR